MEIKIGGKFKDGYMGGIAWTGCNYNGYMRYSEINKLVKKAFLEKYKGTKVSCRGNSFSGGQSCDAVIYFNSNDAINSLEEVKANIENYYKENGYCLQIARYISDWDFGDYLGNKEKNIYNASYDEMIEVLYNKYIKLYKNGCNAERLNDFEKMMLKSDCCEKISYLNALYDSFNDCDNNGMVDYFSNMFYKSVKIYIE